MSHVLLTYHLLSTRVDFEAHWFGIKDKNCVFPASSSKLGEQLFLKV